MVPGTEYGTATGVLDEYTNSCSPDFDCRLKTANEKFIGDFVMVMNIFCMHYCSLSEYDKQQSCPPKCTTSSVAYRDSFLWQNRNQFCRNSAHNQIPTKVKFTFVATTNMKMGDHHSEFHLAGGRNLFAASTSLSIVVALLFCCSHSLVDVQCWTGSERQWSCTSNTMKHHLQTCGKLIMMKNRRTMMRTRTTTMQMKTRVNILCELINRIDDLSNLDKCFFLRGNKTVGTINLFLLGSTNWRIR